VDTFIIRQVIYVEESGFKLVVKPEPLTRICYLSTVFTDSVCKILLSLPRYFSSISINYQLNIPIHLTCHTQCSSF
jgi:hypothetical protein